MRLVHRCWLAWAALALPACAASTTEPATVEITAPPQRAPESPVATSAAATTSSAPAPAPSVTAPAPVDEGQANAVLGALGAGHSVAGLNTGGLALGGGGLGGLGSAPPASAAAPRVPVANVQVGSPVVSGATVSNAPAVVAGMAAGFRRCLTHALASDPGAIKDGATLVMIANLGSTGEVVSVSPAGGGPGMDATAIACIRARISNAQFAPPLGGTSASVRIQLTARIQKSP
jgi:hypothetical protein